MFRNLLLLAALLCVTFADAQKGTVSGTITGHEDGRSQPMAFVNVVLKGTTTGATTDLDGKFSFQAESGTHTLLVSSVGYAPLERPLVVVADQRTYADIELRTQGVDIKEFEVVRTKRTETEGAVVMETRKSEQVVNGIGREQIGKSQDRTAGDVVKRIPGVTMVGDRFVMIRGLADRYNTVLLNDVPAPSLEPDKRAFSFDILPSGTLDRIMVYKTGAPELVGEFAGGVIKLYTMNAPEENTTRVDLSGSFRTGTTFKDFFSSERGATDALGFDNGLRTLPNAFPGNLHHLPAESLTAAGRSLRNNWSTQATTAMPDPRLSVYLARRFGKDGAHLSGGNVTSLSYSNTRTGYVMENLNYNLFDQTTQRADTIYRYLDHENIAQVRMSLLNNTNVLVGKRTKLELRNLFVQQGTEQTTLRTGRNLEEGFEVKNYALRYQQRTIYSGQLQGQHDLTPDVNQLSWTAGYTLALSKEPDFRRVRTVRDINTQDAETPFRVVIPPGAATLDAGRFFSTMNETAMTGKVDYVHKLAGEKNSITLRTGAFVEQKDRTFSARWMSFRAANSTLFDNTLTLLPLSTIFSAQNINNTTGFKLEEGTNPSDRYTAANLLVAGYAGASAKLGSSIMVSAGVRAEHNAQQLRSATVGGARVNVDNPVLSILPSINASYQLTQKAQLRVAYANTVNRPEFRELAPFAFYDFSMNNVLRGNADLKTARIQNIDLRYEHYPSASELFSVGVFHKHFIDPIEMFFLPGAGSGGTRNFTFGNAVSATSLGAEVELRRSFNTLFTEGYLSKLGAMFNAAYVHTTVTLGHRAAGQDQERPLMGQSPYVLNAGLYFQDTERKLQYNVLYNVIGPRLFAVGTYGTPDVYEMPRNVVDIALSKGIGQRLELKLAAQDILNQPVRMIQDSNANGRIDKSDQDIMTFRRGAYLTVGLGLRL